MEWVTKGSLAILHRARPWNGRANNKEAVMSNQITSRRILLAGLAACLFMGLLPLKALPSAPSALTTVTGANPSLDKDGNFCLNRDGSVAYTGIVAAVVALVRPSSVLET